MRNYAPWVKLMAWIPLAAASLALIAGAPFLLQKIASPETDWARLSAISQTYGAVSVLFSAAAFFGVVMSLLYQSRQTRLMHQEIRSSMHRDLILYALGDEALMQCWEPPPPGSTALQRRQGAYINLIYRRWVDDYITGRENLEAIKSTLIVHFRGEIARQHWLEGGPLWRDYANASGSRRLRQVVATTDEIYAQAVAAGPPIAAESYFPPPSV